MSTAETTIEKVKFKNAFPARPSFDHTEGWLEKVRAKAFERFQTIGFPTRKAEAWKYINLEPILETPFVPQKLHLHLPYIDPSVLEPYCLRGPDDIRWVILNERFSEKLSTCTGLPKGVIVSDLKSAIANRPELVKANLFAYEIESNPFALLNTSYFRDGVFIHLSEGTTLEQPLELILITTDVDDAAPVFYPRIVVDIESHAKLDLIITTLDLASRSTFTNAVLDIAVAEDGLLNTTLLQRGGRRTLQLTTMNARIQESGSFNTTTISNGGTITRNEIRAYLKGEKAYCSLNGLGLLNDESQVYSSLLTQHDIPQTTSRQLYKNILGGSSRSEFNSLSYIQKGAVKSDSAQLNRNIVLSKKARAYTRPQLKVFNEDVFATHGATVGQVSEEELFYLRTRGLDKDVATSLLIYGFAEEVVETIAASSIREHVEAFVRSDLDKVVKDAE